MRLIDFKTNKDFTYTDIRCKLRIKRKFEDDSGRVRLTGENRWGLIMRNGVYEFEIADERDVRMLANQMKRCAYNLAYVAAANNDRYEFRLHIVFFYTASRESSLNIILSEKAKGTLKKKHLIQKEHGLEESVRDNFLLFDGVDFCYAYTRGKYPFVYEDGEDKKIAADLSDENAMSIRLYGKDYSMLVRILNSEEGMFLFAESVDISNKKTPPMALRIGELTFQDGRKCITEKLRKELETTSGYLHIWDQYTNIEGDFLLRKAQEIGEIHINRKKTNIGEGGLIIYPQNLTEKQKTMVSEGDYLLFSKQLPIYIQDEKMNWKQYQKTLEERKKMKMETTPGNYRRIKKIDRSGYWVIEDDSGSLPGEVVTCSIFGDMQQVIRRDVARKLIANDEAAFPGLRFIIEGKKPDYAIPVKRQKKIEPITPFVKDKIFTGEPRECQKDAIKIALNTPDLAVIQGPPGTGKTTIITAIIERLNENADKRRDNRGKVLVSSFQHDAVRNVTGRLSINSLPAVKFGKQGEDDRSQERAVEEWCLTYAGKLKERNPQIQQTFEQEEFERRHDRYLLSPSEHHARLFLNFAKSINVDHDIDEEIERILSDLHAAEPFETVRLSEKIRRIRTTREAFLDDGPEAADELLADLEERMDLQLPENRKIFAVLEKAAGQTGDEVSGELLDSLKKLKYGLLKKCIPMPRYQIAQPREDILEIYMKMRDTQHRPKDEEDQVLYDLLNQVEYNALEVEKTLAGYNFVYAATVQQSEGIDIRRAKAVGKGEHPVYDTVVIDEAARVNPGDLMIPMSQAQYKIILVGDHRQLPHIYNEEIFEEMRKEGKDMGQYAVKVSMFQYLKEKAEELRAIDGIERTITLDAQYRMHPLLGDFLNENFYKPYGEGFKSPLPAENFAQKLAQHPFMWVDIPNRDFREYERKEGTSRIRQSEAEYIVNAVWEYLSSEKGEGLSYGIITFYSAQVKLIQRLLKEKGISEQVKVGSVDAFQGLEFDVIFLSVVRTHAAVPEYDGQLLEMDVSGLDEGDEVYQTWMQYKEKMGMGCYGFLTSENRLCVALSRQKRLLIVVGDSNIFHGDGWGVIAKVCVPAMKNFYELCEREGAVAHV